MERTSLVFLISPSGLMLHAGNLVPTNNEFIEYTRRIDFSHPESPQFPFSGISICACFKGTGISEVLLAARDCK